MERRKAIKILMVGIFGYLGMWQIKKVEGQIKHYQSQDFSDLSTFNFSSISVDFGEIKEISFILDGQTKKISTKEIWDAL